VGDFFSFLVVFVPRLLCKYWI